jgi:UDP-glucose 4-epimerase
VRIIVTGASGFVGGAILREFRRVGLDCVPVSRCDSHGLDITSEDFAERAFGIFRRCDAIVHAAASLSMSAVDPSISAVNCLGLHNVIASAERLSARCLVYLSSVPVIGLPRHLPVDEEHPVSPPTAYHASKLYGEHLLRVADSASLRTASLRLTSPVGRNAPSSRIFGGFVRRALSNEPLLLAGRGGRRQNYVDTRDVARAVLQCIQSDSRGVFNIAGNASISNLQLAKTCIKSVGSKSAVEFTGLPDSEEDLCWDVSIEKARNHFGYSPLHNIADSIMDCASGLREVSPDQ